MTVMKPVEIVGVFADRVAGSLVLLSDLDTPNRVLPILIGPPEARAIAIALSGLRPERPGTHDLMVSLLDRSGVRLDEAAITELRDGTFYAELFVETDTGLHRESARPSDAVALALRAGAPIVVATAVLDEASVDVRRSIEEPFNEDEIDRIVADFSSSLAAASPVDFEFAEGKPDEDVAFGDD